MARPRKGRKYDKKGEQYDSKTEVGTTNKAGEVSKEDKEVAADKAHNDPAWYSRDERLVIDSASIPFSEPYGDPIDLSGGRTEFRIADLIRQDSTWAQNLDCAPGIMTFQVLPSYGESHDRLSPLNVAATAIYSQVRYVNNGRKNYDPADLMIYLASVAELYSFLNWCRRIYGCAFMYSQANKYLGRALLQSQGIDSEDILQNLANFRYWINTYTNKIASYAVPADITLFYKRAFQFGSVYIEHDGDSIKDQFYLYNPSAFYRFKLDSQSRGMLQLVATATNDCINTNDNTQRLKMKDLIAIGESLLDNIFGDEDFGLMSGDIMKAFDNAILKLDSLPEDYLTIPVHDRLVLSQMENSVVVDPVWRFCGLDRTTHTITETAEADLPLYYNMGSETVNCSSGNVYQDVKGNLECAWITQPTGNNKIEAVKAAAYAEMDKILNVHGDQTDPATVIESIQNMVHVDTNMQNIQNWTGQGAVSPEGCTEFSTGASFVHEVWIISMANRNTSNIGTNVITAEKLTQFMAWNSAQMPPNVLAMKKANTFKYSPKIFDVKIYMGDVNPQYMYVHCLSELDTYAIIPESTLSKMLEVSLLSLFYVPGIAKFVNKLA